MNTQKRIAVSAAELYVLLTREFKRRQARDCSACDIQLPYLVDRHDAISANWELVSPTDCGYGCRELVEELAQEFSRLYDLRSEEKRTTH